MNYPLQTMVQLGVIPPVTYPPDSRYHAFGVLHYVAANGKDYPYLQRRIVPQPGAPNYATINRYTTQQNDRLDRIAAKYMGDPILAWLICDANGAMDSWDLVKTAGTVLSITTPQGVPGGTIAQ